MSVIIGNTAELADEYKLDASISGWASDDKIQDGAFLIITTLVGRMIETALSILVLTRFGKRDRYYDNRLTNFIISSAMAAYR